MFLNTKSTQDILESNLSDHNGPAVLRMLLPSNFIQHRLNADFSQSRIQPARCQRFGMMRSSDNVPTWGFGLTPFIGQPFRKNSSSSPQWTC